MTEYGDPPESVKNNPSELRDKSEETREMIWRAFDGYLETYLLDARAENAGNNGLVFLFRLSLKDMSEEMKQAFTEVGLINASDEECAVKLLKIYSPGVARAEYLAHKEASDVLKKVKDEDSAAYASVPRLIAYRHLDLADEAEQNLNHQGAQLHDKKAEVIVMEWIPGEDLATHILRLAAEDLLKQHNQARDLKGMTFNQIAHEAATELSLTKSKTYSEQNLLEVEHENRGKIYAYIRNHALLDPQPIANRIENTVGLWHEHGIVHGDLHERNIIVADDGRIVILDFGGASTPTLRKSRSVAASVDAYGNGEDVRRIDDFEVIKRLRNLKSADSARNKKEFGVILSKKYEILKGQLVENPDSLQALFMVNLKQDRVEDLQDFITILGRLAEEGIVNKAAVRDMLEAEIQGIVAFSNAAQTKRSAAERKKTKYYAWTKGILQESVQLFE